MRWFPVFLVSLASACGGGGGSADPDAGTSTVINIDAGGVMPGSVRMVVPAYFSPGPQWQRVIAAAPTVGMIIGNPANRSINANLNITSTFHPSLPHFWNSGNGVFEDRLFRGVIKSG